MKVLQGIVGLLAALRPSLAFDVYAPTLRQRIGRVLQFRARVKRLHAGADLPLWKRLIEDNVAPSLEEKLLAQECQIEDLRNEVEQLKHT